MQPVPNNPSLPRVLLIGDSISIGYTLPVREQLAGTANVQRIPENGGPTALGLAKLEAWLGTNRWDVFHFNRALHDLNIHFTAEGSAQLAQPVARAIRGALKDRRHRPDTE